MTNRTQPPRFEDHRPRRDGGPGGNGRGPGGGGGGGQRPPGPPRQPGGRPQPQRRGPPPQARSSSGFGVGSFLLYGLLAIVALVGAGFAYLLIAPPTDLIREQMISQVREQTGRTLRIDGSTGLTFYPSIGIQMGDVSLSAPPGMSAPPTVKMKSLTVAVKVLPLLSRQISVDTLVLDKPVFDLRVDKAGKKSWDFAFDAGGSKPVRFAEAKSSGSTANDGGLIQLAQAGSGGSGDAMASLDNLSLGDVRIVDGTLNYTDEGTDARQEVRAINVKVGLDAIAKPLTAAGDLNWKGEKVAFDAKLTSPKLVMTNKPGDLVVTFAARPVTGGYDGKIQTADALRLDGALSADAPSLRALAAWTGTELPKVSGFGPLNIKGRLQADGPSYTLSNASLGLDGATATGEISARTDGVRPKVNANLRLSQLDLNKYISDEPSPAAGRGGGEKSSGGKPSSIEDILKREDGTRVRGYSQRAGWSTDPIDLSSLGLVDADANLTVGQLFFKNIKVGQSVIKVALVDSQMRADLTEMQLYSGRGQGIVTVDATAPANSAVGANFAIDGVAAQDFLKDAADINWLSGRGNLKLAIATRGGSQKDFVEALNGTSEFSFLDGAITGFNLSKAIREVSQGNLRGLTSSSAEKTDFSELAATFKITNGIAQNDDLRLASPLLRVGGAGEIRLPAREVDYTVKPKLVAALEGQGGASGLSGLEVPVRIHGSLDNPQYTPDFKGLVSDPSKAVDAVKKLGEQFKGKKAGEILDGLLGGGDSGSGNGKVDGKKLLDGLFGR